MTTTATAPGVPVKSTRVVDVVTAEIEQVRTLTAGAGADPAKLLDALDRLTQLAQAADLLRDYVADNGPALVVEALRADIDQAELVGRPYGDTYVRKLARQAGLPPRPSGPRRRIARQIPPQT